MPKIVNVEERKQLIAEATWRVIVEKGMEGATVRNIAEAAGLSLGALRHYFSNQDELLIYAMNLVMENVTRRVEKVLTENLPLPEQVLKILLQVVPVEEQTLIEMEVWFAFIAHSKHKAGKSAPFDALFGGMGKIVAELGRQGYLRDGLDLNLEIERLYAVLDGLAIHALFEPERLNRDLVTRTLTYHLNSILRAEERLQAHSY